MRIELERIDDAFNMQASNENGAAILFDAPQSIGGKNNGFRPMQALLAALGGCSSIDIINIIKKQRQQLDDIKITIDAERNPDEIPSLFTKIHIIFSLYGNLNEHQAAVAVELSMDKYCSVAKILEKTAQITYEVNVISNQ